MHGDTAITARNYEYTREDEVRLALDVLKHVHAIIERGSKGAPLLCGTYAMPAQREQMEEAIGKLKRNGFATFSNDCSVEVVPGGAAESVELATEIELALLKKLQSLLLASEG